MGEILRLSPILVDIEYIGTLSEEGIMGVSRKINYLFDNNEDWEQFALSVGYLLDNDEDIEVLSDSWFEFPMEGDR